MNIAIIGATGMVGARAVAEAASRGHQVDAYSRSGKSVEGATNALAVDMTDSAALAEIVNNHDATIIAVSAGRGTSAQPIIDAHKGLIAAAPTGRLLVVAGAGSLENEEGVRFVNLPGFPEDYKPEALAFSEILDAYRASEGLSWTALSRHSILSPASVPVPTLWLWITPPASTSALRISRLLCWMSWKTPSTLAAASPWLPANNSLYLLI